MVSGEPRMVLVAIRHIGKAEEITFDYQTHEGNDVYPQKCLCQSSSCHGVFWSFCKPRDIVRPLKTFKEYVSQGLSEQVGDDLCSVRHVFKQQVFPLIERRLNFYREDMKEGDRKEILEPVGCSLHHWIVGT
jgi:hypothetical protein